MITLVLAGTKLLIVLATGALSILFLKKELRLRRQLLTGKSRRKNLTEQKQQSGWDASFHSNRWHIDIRKQHEKDSSTTKEE
ncbi:hypothetical protein HB852_04575 [Listeria grandensis]|uniref:Uncharacterized protein n=1 Tax=Listeria grandensis TaxID=1494963 RepID=A0A7X0Y3C0_9LIST|nr:hypothetical protein [Listeria grandensis]MBC1473880.1 hypothetical protein [Listeria grandensis]MBC1936103.1 hypothetical protein [Listeria grandensis]